MYEGRGMSAPRSFSCARCQSLNERGCTETRRFTMRRLGHASMLAGLVLSGLALGLMASAATPDSSNALDPGSKLNIWQGRWNEIVQTKETPYGHAASTPAHSTCSWTADRGY